MLPVTAQQPVLLFAGAAPGLKISARQIVSAPVFFQIRFENSVAVSGWRYRPLAGADRQQNADGRRKASLFQAGRKSGLSTHRYALKGG